jgi:hypothetical protein
MSDHLRDRGFLCWCKTKEEKEDGKSEMQPRVGPVVGDSAKEQTVPCEKAHHCRHAENSAKKTKVNFGCQSTGETAPNASDAREQMQQIKRSVHLKSVKQHSTRHQIWYESQNSDQQEHGSEQVG